LVLEFRDVDANDTRRMRAHWGCALQSPVSVAQDPQPDRCNGSEFADGKIIRHVDRSICGSGRGMGLFDPMGYARARLELIVQTRCAADGCRVKRLDASSWPLPSLP
jgi:hypothetical protein